MLYKHLQKLSFLAAVFLLMGAGCISVGDTGDGVSTTGPAGMFISSDKGDSWQKISSAPTVDGVVDLSGFSVYRLITDPQDAAALYWGSRSKGAFFSYDKGKSWQRASSPVDEGFIYSMAVHPDDKCTLYATNGTFLYKSIDCSRSWTEVYRETKQSVTMTAVSIHNFPPYEVVAVQDNGTVLKSTDAGNSWVVTKRFKEKGLRNVINDPLQEGVFYAAFDKQGLVKSIDSGETWVSLKDTFKKFTGANRYRRMALHPFKLNVVYWISDYGILKSEDGGESWEAIPLITSPGSAKIFGFAINPQNDNEIYYTATIQNRSTLYKTIDAGVTWTTKRLPSGQIPTALHMDTDSELLYVGFTIPPQE